MSKTATQVMEEEWANEAAKILQEEIDWEIISEMLISVGWVRVGFETAIPDFRAKAINDWLHTECKYHWKRRGGIFIFENRNEAALFKLTWL